MEGHVSVDVALTSPMAVSIEAHLMMRLLGKTQMWVNPFGTMPTAALIFPVAIGIGFKIEFPPDGNPPVVKPLLFELEFGVALCRGAKMVPKNEGASSVANDVTPLDELDPAASAQALDRMLAEWRCDGTDPYGDLPTVMKIALFVNFDFPPTRGFQGSLREISAGRLILAMLPRLGEKAKSTIFKARSFLDIFYVGSLDVSVSSAAFPIVMYSGTVIPAGILFDMKDLNFFNFIKIDRALFYFRPIPLKIEAQLYIRPFAIKLMGVDFFSVAGLQVRHGASSGALILYFYLFRYWYQIANVECQSVGCADHTDNEDVTALTCRARSSRTPTMRWNRPTSCEG